MPAEITRTNPSAVRAPTGYSHSVSIRNIERLIAISGQVGVALDGSVPADGEGQIKQAFANLKAVLEAQGLTTANVIKTTVFLTDRALIDAYRAARSKVFTSDLPASTLLFVAGLADPRWVVEIEAEAAA
jgi:enamine deaminase RidA (YjgF/YER057c/UK114 family)